uniref:Uncharacterized protein n=1 Tax=Utricularia reniformis TaxID=192314 RepID=A0A1Y0B107_9LAMI|nr:hypothetical protein AEK19_MT0915 [Utricularia reniformis]ART31142.1 hypothetical protein AEK19_MT0915 [Utricularia reniformis]
MGQECMEYFLGKFIKMSENVELVVKTSEKGRPGYNPGILSSLLIRGIMHYKRKLDAQPP